MKGQLDLYRAERRVSEAAFVAALIVVRAVVLGRFVAADWAASARKVSRRRAR